jgi:hypothetical protein
LEKNKECKNPDWFGEEAISKELELPQVVGSSEEEALHKEEEAEEALHKDEEELHKEEEELHN